MLRRLSTLTSKEMYQLVEMISLAADTGKVAIIIDEYLSVYDRTSDFGVRNLCFCSDREEHMVFSELYDFVKERCK